MSSPPIPRDRARRFGRAAGGAEERARLSSLWPRLNAFLSLRSRGTQAAYAGIVKEWCEFLGAEAGSEEAAGLVAGARDYHAMAYRKWLEGRPGQLPRLRRAQSSARSLEKRGRSTAKADGAHSSLANSTIAKKFAALRRIYRMLIAADIGIRANPFDVDAVPPPPARSGQKRPTEMLDFKMVKKVVFTPEGSTPKAARDRAILAVLFGGGLRRGEASALRVGDVRRTRAGTVYVRLRATKGKRDADQALPEWAGKLVAGLAESRKREGAAGGDFLFVSYRGRGGRVPTSVPISTSGIYRLFKECCRKAGAGDFLTPHSARATAITKLLADGLSHRHVQEFSRHASVQMVEVYDKRRIEVDESPAKGLDYEE